PISYRLLVDRDGALWIGTVGEGLFRLYTGKIDHFARSDGLTGDSVWALFEDREGNVWVGTENGIDRFRERKLVTLSKRDGLSGDDISSVVTRAGSVCVAVKRIGLDCIEDHGIKSYGDKRALSNSTILSMSGGLSGALLIGTSKGIYSFRGNAIQAISRS